MLSLHGKYQNQLAVLGIKWFTYRLLDGIVYNPARWTKNYRTSVYTITLDLC